MSLGPNKREAQLKVKYPQPKKIELNQEMWKIRKDVEVLHMVAWWIKKYGVHETLMCNKFFIVAMLWTQEGIASSFLTMELSKTMKAKAIH